MVFVRLFYMTESSTYCVCAPTVCRYEVAFTRAGKFPSSKSEKYLLNGHWTLDLRVEKLEFSWLFWHDINMVAFVVSILDCCVLDKIYAFSIAVVRWKYIIEGQIITVNGSSNLALLASSSHGGICYHSQCFLFQPECLNVRRSEFKGHYIVYFPVVMKAAPVLSSTHWVPTRTMYLTAKVHVYSM